MGVDLTFSAGAGLEFHQRVNLGAVVGFVIGMTFLIGVISGSIWIAKKYRYYAVPTAMDPNKVRPGFSMVLP